ncbi:hypothetical protein EG68_08846 [Paragonimus skrjabini miyazakii]|uniref:Uncharacterized protein n=1 Tax=Paragonimus skrjabini miyazakii TaxID=59628 RepID=A0A8S9YIG1_9TREM|nr:hypothetical protein EG68_08846 [Paragonimus skrjabini miyazakii]
MWEKISTPVLQTWAPEEISFSMAWSRQMTSAQWLERFSTVHQILSDEGFKITGLFSKCSGETSFRVTRANAHARLTHLIQGIHTSSEQTQFQLRQTKYEQPNDGTMKRSLVALKDYITNFPLSSEDQTALIVTFNETLKDIDERNQQGWFNEANAVAVFDDLLDTWSTRCTEANLIAMEYVASKQDSGVYLADVVQTECTDNKRLHYILELFEKHRIIIAGLRFGWVDESMVQHLRQAKLKNFKGEELKNCAYYDILAVVGTPDGTLQELLSNDRLTATIVKEKGEQIYLTDYSTTAPDKFVLMGGYLLPYCKLQSGL